LRERKMNELPNGDERRRHPRYPLATGMEFHHGPSRREVPARSVDISAGGIRMYVPPSAPVRPGQPVRMNMGAICRPEMIGMSRKSVNGTIVRVDRNGLTTTGCLSIGVRFAAA